MKARKNIYEKRLKTFEKIVEKRTRIINKVSNLRLLTFLAGVGLILFTFFAKYYFLCAAALIVTFFSFGSLVFYHQKLIDSKRTFSSLYHINERDLKRLNGEWMGFLDSGEEFKDEGHRFALDLDIFGRGSLFQCINGTKTYMGRQRLKTMLKEPLNSKEEILKRQEAIGELAGKLGWRQRFEAQGMNTREKVQDPGYLIAWAEKTYGYQKLGLARILTVLPFLTIALTLGSFSGLGVPFYIPLAFIVLQYFILRYKSKERQEIFAMAYKYREDIRAFDEMLKTFENRRFHSTYINGLKERLKNDRGLAAWKQVKEFVGIVDSISNRFNAFYYIFNLFTLWDYRIISDLEKWKQKSGKNLRNWLETVGEAEALSSLAVLRFDHPEWSVPKISESELMLDAAEMGHPLLHGSRVCNNLKVGRSADILLITGSNMSGKSTLLRTAGINVVLALIGAPVCAGDFCCSVMEVYTCMRVSDNLERNISSFYAEILRIKMVIRAVEEGKRVFFLLDEIFKGTNSRDRHMGAKVLITKLEEKGALGLVSTHDLELAELEEESKGKIKNYHFREYYKNNEIYFDYKLRAGVSTTRNAIYLMRMAGIEVEERDM
ncbi:MAG: DNA mismatch repair protein MutS [Clostridia bacterium]|nr:DNA mismatch repair protein MutS [Clostridia bacterium]